MQFYIDRNQVDISHFFQQLEIQNIASESVLQSPDVQLYKEDRRVYLQLPERQKIEINIPSILNYHQRFFQKNSKYNQPLFKAIGLKRGKPIPSVFDCTAGMMGDALLMYSVLGSIWACERNPTISLLIELTLKQHQLNDFHFHHGSCLDQNFNEIDTIYYDPMYEEKNTKSAPKKEMVFFRELIGSDPDREETINRLLSFKKRLVVKRSVKANPILKPHMSFGKKSTIYDVYLAE